MTTKVIILSPQDTLAQALEVLLEKGIKRVPVVDKEGRILGLVGRTELLRAFSAAVTIA